MVYLKFAANICKFVIISKNRNIFYSVLGKMSEELPKNTDFTASEIFENYNNWL